MWETLQVIGFCLLMFLGVILLNVIAYVQVTWSMTPKDKAEFDAYIVENGILGDWD